MSSEPYVVADGDYLTSIAYRHGTTVDDIVADPKNSHLKELRANPEILAPLDVVHLPKAGRKWLPVSVGETNAFTATPPTVTVQVTLRGPDGAPLAGKTVTTHPRLGEDPIATDGDGLLKLEVSVTQRTVEVTVEDTGASFLLRVGYLDPHDTKSGVVSRLRQLGHLGAERDCVEARPWLHQSVDAHELTLARGVESFQRANGKEPTGLLDDALCAEIRDAHGC